MSRITMNTLLVLVGVFVVSRAQPRSGCFLDMQKDFTHEHPLVLQTDTNDFVLPSKDGLQLSKNQAVRLECTGNRNGFRYQSDVQKVTATCIGGTTFSVGDDEMEFKDLGCQEFPYSLARYSGKSCSGDYKEIEIGFDTTGGFAKLITNCFDPESKESMYSWHVLPASIGQQQEHVPRPNKFIVGEFYDGISPSPAVLFTRKTQRTTFDRLLQSEELAEKYISSSSDYFLARGHLTPKADFVYASHQRATFYYINVDPQWQTFNGGNWEIIEDAVRDYASDNYVDLVVYTGVYGHASLPDANGDDQKLYLYVEDDKALPVAEIYWKVVYEPNTRKGIAFVGHNNPYEEDVEDNTICKNICDQIDWIKWDPTDRKEGYSYCCRVDDLRNTVSYAPDLQVDDILS